MKWLIDLMLYLSIVIVAILGAAALVFRFRFVLPWHTHERIRHDIVCTRLDSAIHEAELTASKLAKPE